MTKAYNGTAVPRHFVYVSKAGAVIVQLSGNRGQDLYTGKLVELSASTQGSPASDAELDRLKVAGRVDHYNSAYVWVIGLPEPHVYDPNRATSEQGRVRPRTYYVNTLLPAFQLEDVKHWLHQVQLSEICAAEIRSDLIAITGTDGALFSDFDRADEIRLHLLELAPQEFAAAVVAFANVEVRDSQLVHELRPSGKTSELEAIIASQTDTTQTEDKRLLLLVTSLEERKLIYNLCVELKATVQVAASAAEALNRLEDEQYDLLIMDMQLADMHGWEMLGKLREVEKLRHLPIILIADHAVPEDASLTRAVATVDVYLERPLSKARLRQNIWIALSGE
ncbi:MAG: response regulator [Anaerolineaceae bacterium]|nr:response regulator [Anaerolineaceae bacterium]